MRLATLSGCRPWTRFGSSSPAADRSTCGRRPGGGLRVGGRKPWSGSPTSARGKADKGLLRRFLVKVAGLSRAQATRLLHEHRTTGAISGRCGPRRAFPPPLHQGRHRRSRCPPRHTSPGRPPASICVRALHLFGDRRFERLASIFHGHLYLHPPTTCQTPPELRGGATTASEAPDKGTSRPRVRHVTIHRSSCRKRFRRWNRRYDAHCSMAIRKIGFVAVQGASFLSLGA